MALEEEGRERADHRGQRRGLHAEVECEESREEISMTDLAVLVPVLSRPGNVAPLVKSFVANCPADAELHFLVNHDDAEELAELETSIPVERVYIQILEGVDVNPTTWPMKINIGVQTAEADWYLCAADDVAFTPGWWEATKELRENPQIGVIGTNDSATNSGNPRVAAGEHTCHPLLRASYVRDRGTVDEPGKAVHDGYHHWFVDDELVYTAKSRGAWAFCRKAVVEHLHPYWYPGEIPSDPTYVLGEANAAADAELWKKRAPLLGLEVR